MLVFTWMRLPRQYPAPTPHAPHPRPADLQMARQQLRRAGTILAYVYNVAADAGAFGGSPPRLQLEGRIALSRLEGLSPTDEVVVLEPAEGPQHEMRERVSGLLDFGAA